MENNQIEVTLFPSVEKITGELNSSEKIIKPEELCSSENNKTAKECAEKFLDEMEKKHCTNEKVPYKMCPRMVKYGECYRRFCGYAHTYEEMNVRKCRQGLKCEIRNCHFLHPDESIKDYCQRTGQGIYKKQSIYRKRKRYDSPPPKKQRYDHCSPPKRSYFDYDRPLAQNNNISYEMPNYSHLNYNHPDDLHSSQNLNSSQDAYCYGYHYAVNIHAKREIAIDAFTKALFSGARQINVTVD